MGVLIAWKSRKGQLRGLGARSREFRAGRRVCALYSLLMGHPNELPLWDLRGVDKKKP